MTMTITILFTDNSFCKQEYTATLPSIHHRIVSSMIFIVMLHLYGMSEDAKIWAKIISAQAMNYSRMEVSIAEGRWAGQNGTLNRPLGA